MNRKDLQVLVGPTRQNPVPDPLAVLHLDSQLKMTSHMEGGKGFCDTRAGETGQQMFKFA